MTTSSHDRRANRVYTLRLNLERLWDGLSFWQQLLLVGAVWNVFWLCMILAFRPYVLQAVAS